MGTNNANAVVVYLTVLDPTAEAALVGSAEGQPISFEQTATTWSAQTGLAYRLLGDADSLAARGVQMIGWGPNVTSGRVEVTVEPIDAPNAPTRADQALNASKIFDADYGSDQISVILAANAHPLRALDTRLNDYAPWNAGDFMNNSGNSPNENCSAGFPMKDSNGDGQTYLLTASHCFQVGNGVFNCAYSINQCAGGPPDMGYVYSRDLTYDGQDIELVRTTYNGGSDAWFWRGDTSNPYLTYASSWERVQPGGIVCTDGAFEGEICNLSVASTQQFERVYYDDLGTYRYEGGVAIANAPSGGPENGAAAGPGDSGGPVYRDLGSSVVAEGTISAGNNDDSVGQCVNYGPWLPRNCTSQVMFTDIADTISQYGITLMST